MFKQSARALAFSAALLGTSLAATAAPMTFYGMDQNPGGVVPVGGNAATARNSFLSNLTSVGNEDFSSFSSGQSSPLVLSFPGSSGSLSATLSSIGGTVIATNQNPVGQFSTSPSMHLDAGFGSTLSIDFLNPISAFGFYGTDISDSGGDLVVSLTDALNNITLFNIIQNAGGINNGNVLFWGFLDTGSTYTNVSIRNTSSSDRFGFDDMVIGDRGQINQEVPEPGALLLFGTALAGIFGIRRRKSA